MVYFGEHLVRSASTTQGIVSLSYGESEFYAAVKGTSISLGVVALLKDMGVKLQKPIDLKIDSTACMGIAGRKGAGRVRHIHTPALWIQAAVHEGKVTLGKEPGTTNPADLGTKPLPKAAIESIMKRLGFAKVDGKSRIALKAAVGA